MQKKPRKRRHLSGGWKKERRRKKEEKIKKIKVKLVTRWGRRDGGKRREGKRERDGISRAVGKEKMKKKGGKEERKWR